MTDFQALFATAVTEHASDLFIKIGVAPALRINGQIKLLDGPGISSATAQSLFEEIIGDDARLRGKFDKTGEVDASYEIVGLGRFRVNIYKQRGRMTFAFRYIRRDIPNLAELHYRARLCKNSSACTGD
jgi:twitching motility protein PilT